MAQAGRARLKFEQKTIADAGKPAHLRKAKTIDVLEARDGTRMAKRTDAVTKARAAEPGTVIVINVSIEEGDKGLLYATSPDLKGLFVAAPTIDELEAEIPRVIQILLEEQTGDTWKVWPASKGSERGRIPDMWAALPPHVAAAALGGGRSKSAAR